MLGDGLSGKTTLLKAIATEIALLEYEHYLREKKQKIPNEVTNLDIMLKDSEYDSWLREKNPNVHSYLHTNLKTGTLGIETINFLLKDPKHNGVIKLKGYDLGGQNIYDHLRKVLSGLATLRTKLIAVFDSTRRMSCKNSLRQIKQQLSIIRSKQQTNNPFIFVFNKIDLKEILSDTAFQEKFSKSVMNRFDALKRHGLTLNIPHLLDSSQFITIQLPKSDEIGFENLEAIIYDTFRQEFIPKHRDIITEENAKALARELAYLLMKDSNGLEGTETLLRLEQIIFAERPLALQYLKNLVLNSDKKNLELKDYLQLLRMRYEEFVIDLKDVTSERIKSLLELSLHIEPILKEVQATYKGPMFRTNALGREGIRELLHHLIEHSEVVTENVRKVRLRSLK